MTRTHHAPNEVLPRHQHSDAFAALVLSGHYAEAGDTGRHCVGPGDVLVHQAFESHIDRFAGERAEVLVIALEGVWQGPLLRILIADPDRVVRVAERDPRRCGWSDRRGKWSRNRVRRMTGRTCSHRNCAAIRAVAIGDWAERMELHPGSISRGFRQVFGLTPAAFRLRARTHDAIAAIRISRASLCEVAGTSGFADQAHMSRAVGKMAGMSPARLRRMSTPSGASG